MMNETGVLDPFALILGDAVEEMKKMPADTFDMAFADPPYFLSDGGTTVQSGKRVLVDKADWDKVTSADEAESFQRSWLFEMRRVLKPNATLWVSGTYHSIYVCGYYMQKLGYRILNDIAWVKPNAAPNLGCRCFAAAHETLLWASLGDKSRHVFHYADMKGNDWHVCDPFKADGKQMRSVWAVATPLKWEKRYGKYPTQKPEELLRRVILSSTNTGDLILDPFSGSGTTGVVAVRYGRRFVGIDSNPAAVDTARNRYEGEFVKSENAVAQEDGKPEECGNE